MIGIVSAKIKQQDLAFIAALIAEDKFRPSIEKCYPLSETGEALRHLERGHTKGKVVISIAGEI